MREHRDTLLARIGTRVARRRRALGLTQKDVAERLGINAVNISKIESGERNLTIETLCKLAEALDTTIYALMGAKPLSAEEDEG